jgi:preprotein translocase subunit SecE
LREIDVSTDVKETKTKKMAKAGAISNESGTPIVGGIAAKWNDFTGFLGNVRNEMRKVSSPSMKEVRATTAVVIITVFLFGLYFFLVDSLFDRGVVHLLNALKK